MMSRFVPRIVCAVFLSVSAASAQRSMQQPAQARPLVTNAVDVWRTVELPGTVKAVSTEVDQGPVEASTMGSGVLVLNRTAERNAELEGFLRAVQTTGDVAYHHWLTPDKFGQRFGAADTDVAAVTSWLQSQGLRVESVSRGKQIVRISGTAGALNQAFSTRLDRFVSQGATRVANTLPIHIPEALADAIASISLRGETDYVAAAGGKGMRASFSCRGWPPPMDGGGLGNTFLCPDSNRSGNAI